MVSFVRTLLFVPVIFAGLPVFGAAASTGTDAGITDSVNKAGLLQLAQFGDVEIYVDQYGRRVIVDAYTGEVLGYERPRARPREYARPRPYVSGQEYRRQMRRRELNRDPEFGYVQPDDGIPYKPRPYRNGRPVTGYDDGYSIPADPRDGYLDDPDQSFRDVPSDEYPDAPEATNPAELQPRIAREEPIERKPLRPGPTEPQDEFTTGTTPPKDGELTIAPAEGEPATAAPGDGVKQPSITFGARDDVAALQVLLDRKGASSGVIDGHFGSNVDKALAAYRDIVGENLHSTDVEQIKKDLAATGGDAFINYTITPEDAAGPFVASVPADYGAKAKLDRLSFTSVAEMLAERFHMDEAYLKALNPEAVFGRPGTVIKVANIGTNATTSVTRIVADKARKQVRAYDASGKLVVAYPATIGSSDTPSPSGTHAVARVAFDPDYTYNPSLNFKQGDNNKVLTIPPGPNGPVGSIWIALDKPTYGIHGTPDPSKIGKTESHGCVRLTNWDANELAKLVTPGVPVEFID